MIGLPKRTPYTAQITPKTLPADLRERARLRRLFIRSTGDRVDAQYLDAAAAEIDRLRAWITSLLTYADHTGYVECSLNLNTARNLAGIDQTEVIGEPEDHWPRCDHGVAIPPGDSTTKHCIGCRAAAGLPD